MKTRRERKRAKGGAAEAPHPHMVIMIGVVKPKKKRTPGGTVEGLAARAHLGKRARGGRATGGSTNDITDVTRDAETERKAPNWRASSQSKDDDFASGGRLTAHERQAMPRGEFALPGRGTGPKGAGAGSYPIPDAAHGRNALARVAQHGTPSEQRTVRAAVHRRFPGIAEG